MQSNGDNFKVGCGERISRRFQIWIDDEVIRKRGWTLREFARRTVQALGKADGLSVSHISNVRKGNRTVTYDVVEKCAKTLGINPEQAFRDVGLLPPYPERGDELAATLSQLSPAEVEDVIWYAKAKMKKDAYQLAMVLS